MNASTENLKPPIKEYRARNSVVGRFINANTTRPKKKAKVIKGPKPSMSESQLIGKELILEIINKSSEIGEFFKEHLINQKNFENRIIKRELNLITENNFFEGKIKEKNSEFNFKFISSLLNKILNLNSNGTLNILNFNCSEEKKINLNRFYEKNSEIIYSELYEDENYADCKLLLLYDNFNFCVIDLFKLNINNEKEDFLSLENAKSNYFNFKPYLFNKNIKKYFPDYKNNIKLLIIFNNFYSKNKNVILNFSQISNQIFVFNFECFQIIKNLKFNYFDLFIFNKNFIENLKKLIFEIFKFNWTEKLFDFYKNLCEDFKNENLNKENFKKLGILLNSNEENLLSNLNDFYYQNDLIENVLEPLFNYLNDNKENFNNIFNFSELLNNLIEKIDLINNIKNNIEKFNNLFDTKNDIFIKFIIQGFLRNLDLEKIFKENDKEKKGYLTKLKLLELIQKLTFGFSENNLNQFLFSEFIFDENGNFMYNYLFTKFEYNIIKIIFTKNENKNEYKIFDDFLIQTINENFKHEISNLVLLNNSNLLFCISPINKNIIIFQTEINFNYLPESIEKIGTINLNSKTNQFPFFLNYLSDNNFLITQRFNENSIDLIILDIYNDIIYKILDNKNLNFDLLEKNIVKEIIFFENFNDLNNKKISNLKYLQNNELFILYSKNNILILNPKSQQINLSLKIKTNEQNFFSKTSQKICEKPNEFVGDVPYKILKNFSLNSNLQNLLIFSLKNSKSDFLICFNDENEIYSYSINQLYIKQKAKDIDYPLPKNEINFLLNFTNEIMNNFIENNKNIFINNINNFYSMMSKIKSENLINISNDLKKNLLFNETFKMNIKNFHIENSFTLINIIKNLSLNYENFFIKTFSNKITFDEAIYDINEDYFKLENLIPKNVNNNENKNEKIGNKNLPKRELKIIDDFSNTKNYSTLFDSCLKKFIKISSEQKIKYEDLFKKIDIDEEEILDLNQFIENTLKFYAQIFESEELKFFFEKVDSNKSGVITKDEFEQFFTKTDSKTILNKMLHDNENKKKFSFLNFNFNKFFKIKNPDLIIFYLKEPLNEINNFYNNVTDEIKYEQISETLEKISNKIYKSDIDFTFPNEIIFLESFKEFLDKNNIILTEIEIKNLFLFFDNNEKNFYIYSRNLKNYLKNQTPNEKTLEIKLKNEFNFSEKQFYFIFLNIMKKLLKFCLNINLVPNNFTDQFFFNKVYNKNLFSINYIPTTMIIENLSKQKINLCFFEEKILYQFYLDFENYGIIFKNDLKNRFDSIMKFIYDLNYFTFEKKILLNNEDENEFINQQKKSLENKSQYFEKNFIEKSLKIYDQPLIILTYFSQKKNNMRDLNFLYSYLKSLDTNKDNFLTPKEFDSALKCILPPNIYTKNFSEIIINELSEFITFLNEPTKKFINIHRIILFIILTLNRCQIFNKSIENEKLIFNQDDNLLIQNFKNTTVNLNDYDITFQELEKLSNDYLNYMKNGIFKGLIILNKINIENKIINQIFKNTHKINDYINYYMNMSNEIIIEKFNKRLSALNEYKKNYKNELQEKIKEIDYSKINIPIIPVEIKNQTEKINLRVFQCDLIENFDYFHPDLKRLVNVTKLRKRFLLHEISNDSQNLLNHIEYSLKVNQYLQKICEGNSFPLLKNYGIYVKEIIIDKKLEEDIYIINEKIDNTKYISLYSLIKSNGGLLNIPELINTDMAFYILRYWGKNILNILTKFYNMYVCLKYFTLEDFYISHDGKRIIMKNLYTYSFYNMNGSIYNGPDLNKILLLLDQIPFSDFEKNTDEKIDLIYNNSYFSPEFFINENYNNLTIKMDSFCFGVCMFNILYGFPPESFYSQMKNWCLKNTNLNFNEIIKNFPNNILSKHFFFNPYKNVKEIVKDKFYFIKVLKLKSFSAVVNKKYLNLSTENNTSINGLGIVLDMINACMSVNPKNRPDLSLLEKCDLFVVDDYELILCNKFLDNVLSFYSPDNIIVNNMLFPLRIICAQILKVEQENPLEINNYENFIFNVIRELNIYLFSNTFSKNVSNNNNNKVEESKNSNDDYFMKNTEYYFKNSMIVKTIIDNKIIDLLIFLILRHFNINLKIFKKKFNKFLKDEYKANINNLDGNQFGKLMAQKKSNYNQEMKQYCGRLLSALIDLLYNCVQAMNTYDHCLTLYVENIVIYIVKLFIGEENNLLGDIIDQRDSGDLLKKYLLLRTFQRNEKNVLNPNFKEDELDKLFSIINSNKQLVEIKNDWSPELYYFTIDLYKEAFGENCLGNPKHLVIKNYFVVKNKYSKNIANQLENPLINNKIIDYLAYFGNRTVKINYFFINTEYIKEILNLGDCSIQILSNIFENNPHKNLVNKKNALSYINTIFKGKNENKIRACLDFKVHYLITRFLYTNISDFTIKHEVFAILKEISINLIDMDEISWMFGNNYNKIFNSNYKEKSDLYDFSETFDNRNSNWDSNFSLLEFMNKLLSRPHTFILYFTNRFLGINLQRGKGTYVTFMKEFGEIFSSPLCIKPLMKILLKKNESIAIKQNALDILFNLIMSNNTKIIYNFNLTICNFYEILLTIVKGCIQLPPHLKPQIESSDDQLSKANDKFKQSVKDTIKIIIALQNPYIKTQMFSNSLMIKYMEQNNLDYSKRLNLYEIKSELVKIKDLNNFDGLEEHIIFLIDTFKSWTFHIEKEHILENMEHIREIIRIFVHLFNNEWNLGTKDFKKNCLVFNLVKLFEWLIKKEFLEFLFPKDDESLTMQMILNFISKIRENSLNMKNLVIKINRMVVAKTKNSQKEDLYTVKNLNKKPEKAQNPLGDKYYTLQKIYNFLGIKLMNIILMIFGENDEYYLDIFKKINFGSVVSNMFKIQYETLSLFLEQDNIDISILDNYMGENRLRIDIFNTIIDLTEKYDEIKYQILQSDFITFLFNDMIFDMRKFHTEYKKLSLEFLAYKNSFPLRAEALNIINLIMKKYNNLNKRTEKDIFTYDELIRNIKSNNMIKMELNLIKNKVKGDEVNSVLSFFNIILANEDRQLINMMNIENCINYFNYAFNKDIELKKLYPLIVDYIKKVEMGIESK